MLQGLVLGVMIFLVLEDTLRPAQLMGKGSNMIVPTLFSIAIEQFAGLSLVYGNSLWRIATKPSRFNQITSRPFFGGLLRMQR